MPIVGGFWNIYDLSEINPKETKLSEERESATERGGVEEFYL